MILPGPPAVISAFLDKQGVGLIHPDTLQGFLSVEPETLRVTAAVAFYNNRKLNIHASTACLDSRFPPALLDAALRYAFNQLGCIRLTIEVAASNLKSIKFVETLGAYREATLQDGCSDGDLHIYCLRPERCHFWRKRNGQRWQQRSGGTGPEGNHSASAEGGHGELLQAAGSDPV